jgi:hypothetical protein
MNHPMTVRTEALQVFQLSDMPLVHLVYLFGVVVHLYAGFAVLSLVGEHRI